MSKLLLICSLTVVLLCAVCNASSSEESATRTEFCKSSTDSVHANTPELLLRLNAIVRRPYFRYYKVNLHKECPYWAVSLLCTATAGGGKSPCQVCRCGDDEVPIALRSQCDVDMGSLPSSDDPAVARTKLSQQTVSDMFGGSTEDNGEKGQEEAEWFDLVKNPEGNTGYTGPMANRVWKAIHSENCFKQGDSVGAPCTEQRVFVQLISGLQSAISAGVGSYFYHPTTPESTEMLPNCELLARMLTNHPDRVENLHTLFLFVLRAVSVARQHYLQDVTVYDTGNEHEDEQLKREIRSLFRAHLLCSTTFDETKILESPRGRLLIPEMQRMMNNITTLMDCVECEKCRLWGKLQTRALVTAFKIVMSRPEEETKLTRGELVSLMNFLRQLAQSVYNVKNLCVDGDADDPLGRHDEL